MKSHPVRAFLSRSATFVAECHWPFAAIVFVGALVLTAVVAIAEHPAQEKDSPKSVWEKVYTEAQAIRGNEVYRQECAGCHLESLGGADMAPGLAGDAFLTTWNELSVGDLFERIRISMPQDTPASLSRQAYIDIVAHILHANKFPAGNNELGHDLAVLKQIKILSKPSPQR